MRLLQKLSQKLLFLKGIDQLAGLPVIGQLRIAENIVGAAGIDLQILLRLNGLGYRGDYFPHDMAVNSRLLLHNGYHGQVDLVDGQPV